MNRLMHALATTITMGSAALAQNPPLDMRIATRVPVAPTPVVGGGGRTIVAYELHITNFRPGNATISRIEVLDSRGVLGAYEGDALRQLLAWPGDTPGQDPRVLVRWQTGIAWIWLALDPGTTIEPTLRHRLTVEQKTFVTPDVAVNMTAPIALSPPVRGGPWFAANGPGRFSPHRLSLMTYHATLVIPQRFGVDWVLLGDDNRPAKGDTTQASSYHGFGADVYAVADASVAAVVDSIPDTATLGAAPAVPMTTGTIAGNYVVLDLGGGAHAFYAHLKRGSVSVRPGERVRAGQRIGSIGNSGDSFGPHLHFHVQRGASPFEAEGIPFVFTEFEALLGAQPGIRRGVMPMQNAVVRFPP